MKHPQQLIPLLLAALLGGLLCLKGGVHPRHGGLLLMGIALLGCYAVLVEGLNWTGRKLWLPLLLGAGITLQLLPIPSGVRSGLSPASQIALEGVEREASEEERSRYWERNTLHAFSVELGESPDDLLLIEEGSGSYLHTPRPLSLDPGKTRWSLVVWMAGGICLLLGIRAGRQKGAPVLMWCLFGLLVAEALVGLWGVRADSLLFFEKEAYLSSATGTLVNRNHFGTLMLVALGMGGTLLVSRERSGAGPALLATQIGTASCFAGLLASQSRFAIGLGGVGVVLGFLVLSRKRGGLPRGVFYGALTVLLTAFAWRTGYFERFDGFGYDDRSLLGRLDIWGHAVEQWRGAMVGGVGLGAFSWAASLQHSDPYLFHFAHAHNDYLQLFTEGGILVGGVFFAAVYAGLSRLFRAWRSHPEQLQLLPLGMGLSAALFHAGMDFPFQIPGVLLIWLTATGWLWGQVTPAPKGGVSIRVAGLCGAFVVLAGAHQAGERDRLEHASSKLLSEIPYNGSDHLQAMEALLRKERPGARRGLGRLALEWAHAGGDSLTHSARLIRYTGAAAAAQRRARDQPLDANAYVSEALAWAHAAETSRERMSEAGSRPEDYAFATEWATHKALWLQPTNPLIYVEAARSQLVLARGSTAIRSHQRRAALLLGRAMTLDPWTASTAFQMAASLPTVDLEVMLSEHPRVLYQAAREWQRRGLRKEALEMATRALDMPDAPKEAGFQRAELIHGLFGIEEARPAYRDFLDSNGGSDTMRGWAFLRIGEVSPAIQAFQRALSASPKNRWAQEGLAAAQQEKR